MGSSENHQSDRSRRARGAFAARSGLEAQPLPSGRSLQQHQHQRHSFLLRTLHHFCRPRRILLLLLRSIVTRNTTVYERCALKIKERGGGNKINKHARGATSPLVTGTFVFIIGNEGIAEKGMRKTRKKGGRIVSAVRRQVKAESVRVRVTDGGRKRRARKESKRRQKGWSSHEEDEDPRKNRNASTTAKSPRDAHNPAEGKGVTGCLPSYPPYIPSLLSDMRCTACGLRLRLQPLPSRPPSSPARPPARPPVALASCLVCVPVFLA